MRGEMRVLLPLLCVLCAARVRGVFDGTCARKDPPPRELVLSPGSKLVLTCRGHVRVNGLTVNIAKNSSGATTPTGHSNNKQPVGSTTNVPSQPNSGGTTAPAGNRRARHTVTGTTVSPITIRVHQTAASRLLKNESTRAHEEKSSDGDYGEDEEEEEEEEEEEGNRVTRGINSSPHWKWNGNMMESRKRQWGEIIFERRGAVLSLPSVRPTDSGSYSCHHRGRQRFSLKVTVADPPKRLSLSCYKRAPSSKLRCESDIQIAAARPFSSYLMLNKRPSETFHPWPCSYSSRLSRYWCALEYNEDELRILHTVYLCVTSITGNATSDLLSFTPLDILKPDPPSSVMIHQVEGRQTYMRVTWNFPISWKSQNNYYQLIYEIKYKPVQSSALYEQQKPSKTMSSRITDVMPGVDYQVQVRAKDEYDGQWSEWSEPVCGRSWTEPRVFTTPQLTSLSEGSAFPSEDPPKRLSLSCYKRAPSSKLRCESDIQIAAARPFSSYLMLNKRPSETFHPWPCSYSSRLSRYWCALEYNEDELRILHTVYLCVTSITGNATSDLLSFTPLDILKPDPPSSVMIHQVEGRQTYMRVTWNFPISWKSQNNYYQLIYEIKYKPVQSSALYEQQKPSKTMSSRITDVMPGVEYQVQVRAKDEYDGQWSEWSEPVCGRSWTEPRVFTTPQLTSLSEGSAFPSEGPATAEPAVMEVSHDPVWIFGFFLLLALVIAVSTFRHRERFMPKLHHLSVISQHGDSSQASAPGPAAHEAQALVTFALCRYKEHQQSNTEEAEEENEEEQHMEDRMEAMRFNNTSYFLLQ